MFSNLRHKFQYILNTYPTSSSVFFEIILEIDPILLALGLGSYILYPLIDLHSLYVSSFYPDFTTPNAYNSYGDILTFHLAPRSLA